MYILSKGHVIAAGNVPFEPRVKEFDDGGIIVSFGLNVEKKKGESGNMEYQKMNVTSSGHVARIAAKLQKYDTVLCAGTMQSRTYTDREGNQKTIKEMKCEFLQVMNSASNGMSGGNEEIPGNASQMGYTPSTKSKKDSFIEADDEYVDENGDPLPF